MPRPLVIGNGNLLVALDANLSIRDLTFPYVGLLNHVSGNQVRLGVWANGRFAWLNDPRWRKRLGYEPDTLVTSAHCSNVEFGLDLHVSDCVVHRDNILIRRFAITNHTPETQEVRLFQSQNLDIAETDIGDTAYYDPFLDAMVHYKRDNYFLITGGSAHGGIYQYTAGICGFMGAEGTWRDAEDGRLSMNPIEQGSVDSTVSFRTYVPSGETSVIRAWICVGHNISEVTRLHYLVLNSGPEEMQRSTANYWVAWSKNEQRARRTANLPPKVGEVFQRSLLVIRTNVDNRGAILAANDSDIMQTARAHYSYMWPRDGALVSAALDGLGYQDITRRFFTFCRDILPKERAVLMHKYSADGSWGATWHPWIVDGHHEVPFQQDSTALVLWSLWRHFERYKDLEFIEPLYGDLVVPAADFMVYYRDPNSGLPLPSYDLWEERRGVNTYACGTVYGALKAAESFARVFNDGRADSYREAAEQVQAGILAHVWDEGTQRFARRVTVHPDGTVERDLTIDSALYSLFAFGAFPVDDPHIRSTMRQVRDRLRVRTNIGGMARYENDYYFRRSDDIEHVPGSPWIICTLWMAQYLIACAGNLVELAEGLELLKWAANSAMETGVLPEQVHPYTGEAMSVAPLTWSHAEFVSTTLQYMDRLETLRVNKTAS